jgi:hypothetical protein
MAPLLAEEWVVLARLSEVFTAEAEPDARTAALAALMAAAGCRASCSLA